MLTHYSILLIVILTLIDARILCTVPSTVNNDVTNSSLSRAGNLSLEVKADVDEQLLMQLLGDQQPQSVLARLTGVLKRYGLRLPAAMLMTSVDPDEICSRDSADMMKRE